MKIGYILGIFPKLSERTILNELVELIKNEHEIYIFSLNKHSENIEHPEIKKYDISGRVYYFDSNLAVEGFRSLNLIKFMFLKGNLSSKAVGIAKAQYFLRTMKELDIDILHSHFANQPTFTNMLMSKLSSTPYTFTAHAFDIFIATDARALEERAKNASAVLTVSHYNKDYIRSLTKIEEEKIHVIRPCIDTNNLKDVKREEENHSIITVARLVEKKGIKYAILAVQKLIRDYPKIQYRIVGSGPLEKELNIMVKTLGLDEYVKFLGSLDDESLNRELGRASVFVLPCIKARNGDMDGLPLSAMEAMAVGIPVISTNISGIPELIENGREGFLVEPESEDQLAGAIRKLLDNKALRNEMGKNGKKKIEKDYNIHKEVKKLIGVWSEIIE